MSSTAARSLGISLRRLWRLHQGHACMLPAARQLWLQTQPWQSLQPDCVKPSAGLAVRSFSAQPGSDADTTPTRNMQLRLMHVVAIGMLIVAAARIIPIVWSSPIPQVLQLLEAEEPIMQKAALHRLQSLAESDNNLDELLEGRAALKVVKMLKQPNADSDVLSMTVSTMKELSRTAEGRRELLQAEAPRGLQQALQQGNLQPETAVQAKRIMNWLQKRSSD